MGTLVHLMERHGRHARADRRQLQCTPSAQTAGSRTQPASPRRPGTALHPNSLRFRRQGPPARPTRRRPDCLSTTAQWRSRRVLHRSRQWLQGVAARDLPPSDSSDPVGKVARYYLVHFDELTRFVDHVELPLDNNHSKREFQRHAKQRHASLFAGSSEGAHRWATLLGVVRTSQKRDLDVQAYLT